MCLGTVRGWYDLPRDVDDDNRDGLVDGYSAFQQWLAIPPGFKIPTGDPNSIPRGALVFWEADAHGLGHIAIALGNGRVRTTWGTNVYTLTISYVNSNGYRLLGWSYYLCDTIIDGILPEPEEDIMALLPDLDWRRTSTKIDPWTRTIQGLLQARGCYIGYQIDGKRGKHSIAELARFQVATNSGDGRGKADKLIGARTWESLLTGKKW